MQINTDISPIISPKSNNSISFMSPRDIIFTNMNPAKNRAINSEKSPTALNSMTPGDMQGNRGECEVSQNANTTQNESYSVEKNPNGKNNSLRIASLSSQYNINETLQESDSGEMMKENVQIIEYEEFHVDRLSEANNLKLQQISRAESPMQESQSENFENKEREHFLHQSNLDPSKETNNEKEVAPTPKTTNKKFLFNFGQDVPPRGTHNCDSSNYQQRSSASSSVNKIKQDPFDLPLKNAQQRHNSVPSSEAGKADDITEQKNFRSMKSSFVSENEYRGDPKTENIEHQLTDVIKAKDDEIDYLKARIKYLEDRRGDKPENIRNRPEVVVKSEKETSTADMLESERTQTRKQISTENAQLKAENKKLVEFQYELQRENTFIKDKLVSQVNSTASQSEDKNMSHENTIMKLKEELILKENEIQSLLQERKVLVTKKTKLKSLLKQRDQFINEFRLRFEETATLNQNEAIQAAMDKLKASKDKIAQMQKQLDQQKELINQRDAALESLLAKMDIIAGANQEKTTEITTLKNEMRHYQEQIELLKKEQKHPSNFAHSHKGSRDNLMINEKQKSTERLGFLPKKPAELERVSKDGFGRPQKVHTYGSKNDHIIYPSGTQPSQLEVLNSDRESAIHFYDYPNPEFGTPKLRESVIDTQHTKLNTKPSILKSIQDEIFKTHDNDKEIKNIKDLQKRLSYLKAKRNEFEKRKEAKQKERDELHLRHKEEVQDPQHAHRITFGGLVGEIQNYDHEVSPFITGKKLQETPSSAEKKRHSLEKESSLKFNTRHFQMDDLGAQAGSSHNLILRNASNFSDGANSRPSSKTRPPNIDGPEQFNRVESGNIFTTKSGIRFESLSNNTSTVKHENLTNSAKFHKKSYDFNAKSSKIFKLSDSPGNLFGAIPKVEKERSLSRPKDSKEIFYKGLGTPGSHAPSRPSEKLFEGKLKK